MRFSRFDVAGAICAAFLLSPSAGFPQAASGAAPTTAVFPAWAYLWVPGAAPPAPDDGVPRHVVDSTQTFSVDQQRDLFFAPDWHPDDHPVMPDIVAKGRPPAARACGSCHRAEGTGGPENSSLAGLPADYILEQLADYKSGARNSYGPRRGTTLYMIAVAKSVSDGEARAAADYFSRLPPRANIKVIEADILPKTYVAGAYFAVMANSGSEPIGSRVVEMPVDVEQFERRDSRAQFLAYVPKGSLARGETLALGGSEKTPNACSSCHGEDLRGAGSIPRIAGRSPSYLIRQMYDFQSGVRGGPNATQMKQVVEQLTQEDMIALAAFVAKLDP